MDRKDCRARLNHVASAVRRLEALLDDQRADNAEIIVAAGSVMTSSASLYRSLRDDIESLSESLEEEYGEAERDLSLFASACDRRG
jgi:hypothetical protein